MKVMESEKEIKSIMIKNSYRPCPCHTCHKKVRFNVDEKYKRKEWPTYLILTLIIFMFTINLLIGIFNVNMVQIVLSIYGVIPYIVVIILI